MRLFRTKTRPSQITCYREVGIVGDYRGAERGDRQALLCAMAEECGEELPRDEDERRSKDA